MKFGALYIPHGGILVTLQTLIVSLNIAVKFFLEIEIGKHTRKVKGVFCE